MAHLLPRWDPAHPGKAQACPAALSWRHRHPNNAESRSGTRASKTAHGCPAPHLPICPLLQEALRHLSANPNHPEI